MKRESRHNDNAFIVETIGGISTNIPEQWKERFVTGNDIIRILVSFLRDIINNNQDEASVLKVTYIYREKFRNITLFPKDCFFIDREKLVICVEALKIMERKLSLQVLKNLKDISIYENYNKIVMVDKVIPKNRETFFSNTKIKTLTIGTIRFFDVKLNLQMNERYKHD